MHQLFIWPKHAPPVRPLTCNLRDFRWQKSLTQKSLAEQLQVSRRTIIAIENQETYPSLVLAFKLADFFQTTLDKLFVLADIEKNQPSLMILRKKCLGN